VVARWSGDAERSGLATQAQIQAFLSKTGAKRARAFDRRIDIPEGNAGTRRTVEEMARLAAKGGRDPIVRLIAQDMTRDIPGRDHLRIACRVFEWGQDRGFAYDTGIKFQNDPVHVEQLADPWLVLAVLGAGDCDDFTTTCCAVLLSLGVPCFIRTVMVDASRPHLYSHVYAVAAIRPYKGRKGGRLALDCSVPFTRPGDEPRAVFGTRDWPIDIPVESDWSLTRWLT
jgi:hypothetical protein